MDFHGVGTKDQKANVLGAIDLDSLPTKLAIMQHHTAINIVNFVRDRILLRHRTPSSIDSNHARELIGRVMIDLATTFNYVNTSTGSYCPTGNLVIE